MDRASGAARAGVRWLEWLAGILLVAMMLLTFVDVLGRYLFSAPIYGATEVTQYLLAGSIFAGLGVVACRDSHITVDLFDGPLTRWMPRSRPWLIRIVTAAGLLLIGYELARSGIEAWERGRTTTVLHWPLAALLLPCAVLSFLAAALQLSPPRTPK